MTVNSVIIISASLLNLLIVYFVFLKNKKSQVNIFFSLLVVCIVGWSLSILFTQLLSSILAGKFSFVFSSLIPLWFVYFAKVFPNDIHRFKKVKDILIIAPSILFVFVSLFTSELFRDIEIVGSSINTHTGYLYPFFSLYLLGYVAWVFVIFVRKYKKSIGVTRAQIYHIFIGTFLFAFFALITNLILPLFKHYQLNTIGPSFSVIMIAFTAYAIIKHRFLDIRFILRKSFIFVGLAIFVFAAYYLALWIDNTLFGGSYSIGGYLSAIIIAPLFLLGFNYIGRWLKHIANKYFFTGLYDYQEVLETFARKISQTIKLDEAVSLVIDTVQGAMRVDDMAIALADPTHQHPFVLHKVIGFNKQALENICSHQHFCTYLQSIKKPIVIDELLSDHEKNKDQNLLSDAKLLKDLGVSLVLPFVVKNEINSVCIVGRKITKEAYTKEDIDLLTTLSNQASVAIENARLYNHMEEMVESATAKLKKMLKTQSEFLDIASHQLRTPVSLIRGIISMMLEGDLAKLPKKKQNEFLQTIKDKSDKLEIIINDILSASDFDSQKFAIHPNSPEIQLEEVVDAAVKSNQEDAKQRAIELKWQKPAKPLGKIKGEQKYLDQAIGNLISNALKYTPSTRMVKEARSQRETKGVVEVSIAQENNNLIVKVKDNGIGIPKEEIPKLFVKFARASNATAMYTDGSGLGLFIVKEIIEGHKGKVWVESEEGKGSTFYISLPLVKNDKKV